MNRLPHPSHANLIPINSNFDRPVVIPPPEKGPSISECTSENASICGLPIKVDVKSAAALKSKIQHFLTSRPKLPFGFSNQVTPIILDLAISLQTLLDKGRNQKSNLPKPHFG